MMKNPQVRITRDLAANDPYNYAHRELKAGDVLYRFDGLTYGCINTPAGVACSDLPGENPFFELPSDAVEVLP